jgi:polysaccharide export outer membrane protein
MGARSFKVQLQETSDRHGELLQKTFNSTQLMKTFKILFLVLIPALLLLSSCANVNSNILFKIPRGSDFEFDSIPMKPQEDFKLASGDRFSFLFGTNNGEKIVLNQSGVSSEGNSQRIRQQNQQSNQNSYLVRQDGMANLPLLGEIYVTGKTILELENDVKNLLSQNYIEPFVQIRVTNQRVIIFPGKGDAQVINLTNSNTSLLEVVALAGGIRDEARSNSIKLMRKIKSGDREIYNIDLSTINGLKAAQMIVQSNDYIYIDFKSRYASAILQELTPWLSLLTTALLTYSIINPN